MKIITEQMKIEIKAEMSKVLSGELDSCNINCLPLNDCKNMLEELGADVDEEFDTNGWQVDYWNHFRYKGKKYVITGSMYYGNLCVARDVYEEMI